MSITTVRVPERDDLDGPLVTLDMTDLLGCRLVAAPVEVLGATGDPARGDLRTWTALTIGTDEPTLHGHYLDFPIFPGVGVIECVRLSALATAPASALLQDAGRLDIVAVESTRFHHIVLPGDRLRIELTWQQLDTGWRTVAQVRSNRGIVAKMRLRFGYHPAAAR